ncbi:MAG: CoA transferase, partial [Actinomycetota bacterium]|nr:CoA transferase [Actinomycetota bacterium]
MTAFLPLDGLQIFDMSTFVAGPLCTLTLAQLGAEVTRIDPSGGRADTRRWPLAPSGESLYWSNLNRGKDIIALDSSTQDGLRYLKRMIADSGPDGGIIVSNAVGQPRLGYDELRTARSDLIHVLIQGKRDGSSAVDYTVNAECGIAEMTGPPSHLGPVNHVLPAWDIACGLHA